jgi:hypothetical protein
VQAALEFVELPGDRERLRSPGKDSDVAVRVSTGRNNVELNSFRVGDPEPSLYQSPTTLSAHTGSVADIDTTPRNLSLTDLVNAGEEEDEANNYDDDDDDEYDDYGEVSGSGWIVAGFMGVLLSVGLHINRKHLCTQLRQGLTLVLISAQLELFCPPYNPT